MIERFHGREIEIKFQKVERSLIGVKILATGNSSSQSFSHISIPVIFASKTSLLLRMPWLRVMKRRRLNSISLEMM